MGSPLVKVARLAMHSGVGSAVVPVGRLAGLRWNAYPVGFRVFSRTVAECWTFDGEAAVKQKCLMEHPESLAARHEQWGVDVSVTTEGSSGQSGETSHLLWVNDSLCPLTSTWKPEIPSGHRGPTMNGQPRIPQASREEQNGRGRSSPVYGQVSRDAGTSDCNDCRRLEGREGFGQPAWQV